MIMRVDELLDDYVRKIEAENDGLLEELHMMYDAWNLQVDFIARQYQEEDFDFYYEHDKLLEALSKIHPDFVVTNPVKPDEGPPTPLIRLVPLGKSDA